MSSAHASGAGAPDADIASDSVRQVPRRGDWRFALIVAVIYAAILVPRCLIHVMWRDEWQAWMESTDGCDLLTLFARVRYEGHPSLWYLLLWGASRVWNDPLVMKAVHTVLATLVVLVIAARGPWPRWQRLMLVASYFVAFEYAVISRNYSLGVLGLLGFAAAYAGRRHAYVACGVCLAVAANANAFAAVVSGCLALWVAVRWFADGRPAAGRFAAGAAVLTIAFLLAAWQMKGPPDRLYTPITLGLDVERGGKMAAAIYRSFIPLPTPTRDWWATNVLDFTLTMGPLKVIQSLLGIVTLLGGAWLIQPSRRDLRVLWLAGAIGLALFGYTTVSGSLRHHGHFFMLFIVAFWLSCALGPSNGDATTSAARWRGRVWTAILTIQVTAAVIASVADVILPFSGSRAAGKYLAANYPEAAIIGHRDFAASPVAGVIGRQLFYATPGRWGTYIVWDHARVWYVDQARLTQHAEKLHRENPDRQVLFLLADRAPNDRVATPDPERFRRIARFEDSTVDTERYTVLMFEPARPQR